LSSIWCHLEKRQGSGPAIHKVARWRCLDLREEVARRYTVTVHES
jgi:hypothetical protein